MCIDFWMITDQYTSDPLYFSGYKTLKNNHVIRIVVLDRLETSTFTESLKLQNPTRVLEFDLSV